METASPKEKERTKVYNKTTLENEKYTLTIKITKDNSIYISIVFENNTNNIFETIKLYDDIKKEQVYFEDYISDEILDEKVELISKDNKFL